VEVNQVWIAYDATKEKEERRDMRSFMLHLIPDAVQITITIIVIEKRGKSWAKKSYKIQMRECVLVMKLKETMLWTHQQ
jgi:hypothetical protein